MELLNNYIPREYLALKINYCRQQLEKLPVVKVYMHASGKTQTQRIVVNNHKYNPIFSPGKDYYEIWKTRDLLERRLRLYQTIWDCNFRGEPPKDCIPHKACRVFYADTNKPVIMNKEYFDSLENDANISHPKNDNYRFNGIRYRSAAERDIAIFYTEMGIPFKYEPKVMLKGLVKPVYPDFVPYFEELDTCKFHEHFGIKDSSDYFSMTKFKFGNFANAGLIQDLDVIFTFDTDDTWFDPRCLSAKINGAIYQTICLNNKTSVNQIAPGINNAS